MSFQVVPCFFTSSATDLLRVVLGLPVFLFPCGFQSKACLVTVLVCFRWVCPIHVHFLLAISLLMLCWPVLLQISLFVVLSCHLVFRMYLRHNEVCSIRIVVLVSLHVSEPYSSTLFTLVLKILILFRVEYAQDININGSSRINLLKLLKVRHFLGDTLSDLSVQTAYFRVLSV